MNTREKALSRPLFFTFKYTGRWWHHNVCDVLNTNMTKVLAHPHPVKEENYRLCKLPVSVPEFVFVYFLHQDSSFIYLTFDLSPVFSWDSIRVKSFACSDLSRVEYIYLSGRRVEWPKMWLELSQWLKSLQHCYTQVYMYKHGIWSFIWFCLL